MKIFVCEYVTGGGLYREPLPPSLAREGELMLGALLEDLGALPQVELLTTRDVRLPALEGPVQVVEIGPDADVWQRWLDCLQQADAFWPIAPEGGGVLERLCRLAEQQGKRLLNSASQAVATAASKYDTAAALSARGIRSVPTYRLPELPQALAGPWVAKPDDGAGCEDTRCFDAKPALLDWLAAGCRRQTHVVQPFIAGEAASLCMLCHAGQAVLLSCNRQLIALRQGEFSYHGSVLNGLADHWSEFAGIAQQVASTLPGLSGYVGVDAMLCDGEIVVMEVNPRLTTSYVALRRAIGCNPARLVLDLIYNGAFQPFPDLARDVVHFSLDE